MPLFLIFAPSVFRLRRIGLTRIPSFVSSTVNACPGFQPRDSRMAFGIVISHLDDTFIPFAPPIYRLEITGDYLTPPPTSQTPAPHDSAPSAPDTRA
jgi:hypothetical protein